MESQGVWEVQLPQGASAGTVLWVLTITALISEARRGHTHKPVLSKPYRFMGFGALCDPKPYKFMGFGAIYGRVRTPGPKPMGPRTPGPEDTQTHN